MTDGTQFYEILKIDRDSSNFNSVSMNRNKYNEIIKKVKFLKENKSKKGNDYKFLKRYDIIEIDGELKLINPSTKNGSSDSIKYFVYDEQLFDILQKVHLSNGHAGRDRMMKVLKSQYQNVTYRDVQLFLSLCETCIQKQKNSQKKGLIVEPMIFQDFISGVHLVADDSMPEQCQELQTEINESGNTEDFITVKEECICPTTSTMSQTEISYGWNSKFSLREILTNDNEFDAFGRNVSLQLQQMPLAAALETQELIQRIIRQKRVSILRNTQAITNMSECDEN